MGNPMQVVTDCTPTRAKAFSWARTWAKAPGASKVAGPRLQSAVVTSAPKATGDLTPFHPAVTVALKLSRSAWSWLQVALRVAGAKEHWAASRPACRQRSTRQRTRYRFMGG